MRKSITSAVLAVCILLSANSVFALNLYNYTTKVELYLDDEGWSEKGLEGYKKERREEGFIPEDEIPAEDWVTLYSADGRTMKTVYFLVDTYKNLGWTLAKPVTMYASDGRTISVLESEVEDYKKVGWYFQPFVTMYSADGRTQKFPKNETYAQSKVGWYYEPPVTLYSADGRSQKFAKSEAEAQKKVGWYESLAEAKAAAKAQSAQQTAQPKQEQKSSYSISGCYENTRFRTFTNITGISYSDKSSTDTGSTIYNYGYVPEEYIYSYIAALQNDGLTYDGAENYGVSLLLTMRDTNSGAMLIMAYDGFGKTLRISVAP